MEGAFIGTKWRPFTAVLGLNNRSGRQHQKMLMPL
jgi:hypothetical protein